MAVRYLGGERPAPRPAADGAPRRGAGPTRCRLVVEKLDGCLVHEALAALWEFVGAANKTVDAEAPWVLAKAAKAGDEAAAARLRGVLGDLLEACRLVGPRGRPGDARRRAAGPRPARLRVPVGAPTATADRRSSTSWPGAPTPTSPARWPPPTPLFPRLEIEVADASAGPAAALIARPAAMRLVDSHAHLQSPQFADDLDRGPRGGRGRRRGADPRARLG